MLSNSLVRSAFGASRGRVGGLNSRVRVSAPLTAPMQHQWQDFKCCHSVEGKRWISVYGYIQAKALVYSRYGEPKDVLQLHKHSISAPHGTQVNLRLLAAPLNPADVNQIQGVYPSKPPFQTSLGTQAPCAVAGNEGAFEVIATGSNVTNLSNGDWVVMKQTGQGTWRTHAQMDESQLIKIENKEGLTPLQISTVSVNPVTAYRMIKDFCDWDWMRAGEEWLIQNGANSGVGRAAIQLAREWGIKTLNVVRERKTPEETEKLKQELRDLGATAVVTEAELLSGEFKNLVHDLTRKGREPIRLALNCVGGKSATALAKTLAPGSRLVTYGAMSKQPVALPSGLLIFKDLAFHGFWVSKWGDKNPQLKENTINDVLQLTRTGKFKDIPVEELKWRWDTECAELVGGVQETLSGFRSGKGLLRYEAEE
ncbi:mitochondrial enoyl reductase [Aspergillus uvarum CBS 121591]|uniref:enoyl-[acyl-carrier-protein] reductase n=1 Tax=Aspergillus uvarum CBS 121591 TaxID=1448315 RepID=A0A319BY97_9EURO|nr:mitochondrial enoyl reductase [Aspergillus uvarum CBS 121591]PYH78696.1 mitochondrial enoyl reductase [Aspergillus uvarum CBS 121591]